MFSQRNNPYCDLLKKILQNYNFFFKLQQNYAKKNYAI